MPMDPGRVRHLIRAVDVPIVVVAAVLATVMLFYAGTLLETDRCLDAGGRIAKYGLDHVCETGGGSSVPLSLTARDRAVAVAAWIVLVTMLSWGMTRMVGRTPRT